VIIAKEKHYVFFIDDLQRLNGIEQAFFAINYCRV